MGGGAPIQFRDVVVRYAGADRNAVDGISLEVEAGALVVLLGPSGCGKSTLLRTVNRMVELRSGTVSVDGNNVCDAAPPELRRGIGYVIQAVGLFPHLTVAQNIAIVPELLRWDRERTAQRTDELLELVRLEPARYRGRYPRELSGGEAQRVGVARALAAQPRVLLMDEPFGAVDAIVRSALQDETIRIQRALGTTVLFVTHDVDEALRIADRIVVMSAGNVVQYGTPLHVLGRPASPYVERLLDTRDAVRRLSLLRVEEAMTPPRDARPAASIASGASLREALSAFLEGPDALAVLDGERVAGNLTFGDVKSALRGAE